ncbi:hypothetical protein [Kitasatospora sp. NPDC057198]|uniref:hypothetical protein n=1 Tax=Kitasatospora sp. NPDC057198 TaxID=3346046 RepID=UPI00363BA00C
MDPTADNLLELRVLVPPAGVHGAAGAVECRPVVDGRDVLAGAFDEGPAADPDDLLVPGGPLEATDAPHEVLIAEAECTEGCCGALRFTVRREGRRVVWGGWRNPADNGVGLPEFRFDAEQYAAELRRAAADRGWEWPARTVARLLRERLRAHPDWPGRWDCELRAVEARPGEPEQITVLLEHSARSAGGPYRPRRQFRLSLAVTGEEPADQAERLLARLTAGDPRGSGEPC